MSELAARLAADPEWRWMPGMLALDGHERWRYLAPAWVASGGWLMPGPAPANFVPDLTDPATVGCLLAMLLATGEVLSIEVVGLTGATKIRLTVDALGEAVALRLLAVWGAR